jgi:hypothetical protein
LVRFHFLSRKNLFAPEASLETVFRPPRTTGEEVTVVQTSVAFRLVVDSSVKPTALVGHVNENGPASEKAGLACPRRLMSKLTEEALFVPPVAQAVAEPGFRKSTVP